jgi:hypothetical protein
MYLDKARATDVLVAVSRLGADTHVNARESAGAISGVPMAPAAPPSTTTTLRHVGVDWCSAAVKAKV